MGKGEPTEGAERSVLLLPWTKRHKSVFTSASYMGGLCRAILVEYRPPLRMGGLGNHLAMGPFG